MQTLPKYFVIKWSDSPLFNEYIKWLGKTYGTIWDRPTNQELYYGYDGNNLTESGCECYSRLGCFSNKVEVITLEQWNEAVNTPQPVKSKDMRKYYKVDLKPNAPKLAEDLCLMACLSNSGLNVTLDALKNNTDEHLNGSSSTLQGNVLTLFQSDKVVLIIEEREEFIMPETKDY